jgi:hypothetical protein
VTLAERDALLIDRLTALAALGLSDGQQATEAVRTIGADFLALPGITAQADVVADAAALRDAVNAMAGTAGASARSAAVANQASAMPPKGNNGAHSPLTSATAPPGWSKSDASRMRVISAGR